MKKYTYLISYAHFTSNSDWGFGDIKFDLNKKINEEILEKIRNNIIKQQKYKTVVILNAIKIKG